MVALGVFVFLAGLVMLYSSIVGKSVGDLTRQVVAGGIPAKGGN